MKIKRVLKILPLFLILLGVLFTHAQIQNPGFETGDLTYWPITSSVSVTSSESHWGSYSAEMDDDDESWLQSKTYSDDTDDIDFIDVWLKHPILSGSHYINIIINYEDDFDLFELNDIISGWHRHRFGIPGGDIFEYIVINPHGDFTQISVYVDDVGIYYSCYGPIC